MKKFDFNKNWTIKKLNIDEVPKRIDLPYDAMIREKRINDSLGGLNIGWYESNDYVFEKSFYLGKEFENKIINIEFEGVYHLAEVFVNDKKVAYRPYGYSNFYALNIQNYINFGEENKIQVFATNSNQPNSRWYSGTGIYRPVWLYVGEDEHILNDGIRITTKSIAPTIIEIEVNTNKEGNLNINIPCANINEDITTNGNVKKNVTIEDPKFWSADNPYLYDCEITFGSDIVKEKFGIRAISWSSENGLEINGKREILRGACIHHDNGVLGACTYPEVEERRVRILKENGYNAIRSAHNPCSKALLDACDKVGMYVMDEFVDVWYIHKTKNDYVTYFDDWWETDIRDMIIKDYNHPSVIMYSTGNEVSETAQKRGIELTKTMTEYIHSLDKTRPVTCGINIFFNFLSTVGLGVYSDEKAEKEVKNSTDKKSAVGSEFFNNMAGLLGRDFMKIGATIKPCDMLTKDAFANMDIAGYNYGLLRYKKDLKNYPNRLILGTETFCSDSYKFWEEAKKNKRIIGDFVWAGMDYLGEVGIGSWEYDDYAKSFDRGNGWVTAGSGRIDITGKPLGEAGYTRVAFGLENKPIIAVRPVNHTNDKHSPSAWKMTNAIESWSWRGCSRKMAIVEVYARCSSVKLLINDIEVGHNSIKKDCKTIFNVPYANGKITAISYDKNKEEIARNTLYTAEPETVLDITWESNNKKEQECLIENKLTYFRISFQDKKGIVKPLVRDELEIEVENGELVALGNGCPYNEYGYVSNKTETYFGEAIAVVKPKICENYKSKNQKLTIKAKAKSKKLKGYFIADIYKKENEIGVI